MALNCANVLGGAGYDAYALYGSRHYDYPFYAPPSKKPYFHPPLATAIRPLQSRRLRRSTDMAALKTVLRSGGNHRLEIRPDDVFVLPEFAYPEYAGALPDNRCLLLAQDVLSLSQAFRRDLAAGTQMIDRFDTILTTSAASEAAVAEFTGKTSKRIPQVVSRPSLVSQTPKIRQIAYMPRKRRDEAEIILKCLKNAPELATWRFVQIENFSSEELDQTLNESLIFLAFSHMEGFGLPPAEAMAAGCIVIGYTGVGGDEYFTTRYGCPIQDCDMVSFISTVRTIVAEYEKNPAQLDETRQKAARYIHTEYNAQKHKTELLKIWAGIDGGADA